MFSFRVKHTKIRFFLKLITFFLAFKGDPTEECVRCNKVYLAATAELKQGLCPKCLENPNPSDDQENEDVTISHRHKKFANKLLRKLTGETLLSGTEEELSNASSENLHQVDIE